MSDQTEFDVEPPQFYVCSKGLTDPQLEAVCHALRYHPIEFVFITDPRDHDLAMKFGIPVRHFADFPQAETAAILMSPCLIIGAENTTLLEAYYPDGTKEKVEIDAEKEA
jgi:hypothetical protein